MDGLKEVPKTFIEIIPIFDGDVRKLQMFLKKVQYMLDTFKGDQKQNEYLYHIITSRLSIEVAALVAEHNNINTWQELKELLIRNYGDPRTEDSILLELDSLKINKEENYVEFCHRLKKIQSSLLLKLNETINEEAVRIAKQEIYKKTALKIFIYNMPVHLMRLLRLKNVNTLEDALKIVLEEQNFQIVYDKKNPTRYPVNRFNYNGYDRQQQENFQKQNSNYQNARSSNYHSIQQQSMQNNNQQNRRFFNTQRIPSASRSGLNKDFASNTNTGHRVNYTSGNIQGESNLQNDFSAEENFHIQASDHWNG